MRSLLCVVGILLVSYAPYSFAAARAVERQSEVNQQAAPECQPVATRPGVKPSAKRPSCSPVVKTPANQAAPRQPAASRQPRTIEQPATRNLPVERVPGGKEVTEKIEGLTGKIPTDVALTDRADISSNAPGSALRDGLLDDSAADSKLDDMNQLTGPGLGTDPTDGNSPSDVRRGLTEQSGLSSGGIPGKSDADLSQGGGLIDSRLAEGEDTETTEGTKTADDTDGKTAQESGTARRKSSSIIGKIWAAITPDTKDNVTSAPSGVRGMTNPEEGNGGGLRGQEIAVPIHADGRNTEINTLVDDFNQSGSKTDRAVPTDNSNDPLIITTGEETGPTAGTPGAVSDVKGSLTNPETPDTNLNGPAGNLPVNSGPDSAAPGATGSPETGQQGNGST